MTKGRFWTAEDDNFIIQNHEIMTSYEMAEKSERTNNAVRVRMYQLRKQNKLHFMPRSHTYNKKIKTILVTDYVKLVKKTIESKEYLNLIINNRTENVRILNSNDSYFTVQRANYRESYQFTDLLLGEIKIKN